MGPAVLSMLFPHEATTEDMVVRVAVSFLAEQSAPATGRWFWSYHIRLENRGTQSVQLLTRAWTITDGRGTVHEVKGEGVVGEMPLIAPGASYDYVSGCPLPTPTGSMTGSYTMVDENGRTFDIAIPTFPLVGPV
ncbi:Co2+/Mg2+ efflux protein ApaG [Sphingomonas rosea]|uniref:Protein ApaG n=1 Tax=Sphingomonas rosea TaxID=335605 RepID=A0ABP7UDZ9_9SPHN